jgi:hypothetical protein
MREVDQIPGCIRFRSSGAAITPRASLLGLLVVCLSCSGGLTARAQAAQQQSQQQTPPNSNEQANPPAQKPAGNGDKPLAPASSFAPRGQRLMLKDGSYQIVRSYEHKGDTVRYYSVERSQWEEIPASLVDWDATAKAAQEEKQTQDQFAAKVAKREAAENAGEVLDVDASLEVAPGLILPQDEGLFAVEGRTITVMNQVMTQLKTDKAQAAKRILVPIFSSKQRLEIPGKRATVRFTSQDPEFYYRTDYDADEPEVLLVRAEIRGDKRVVESIKTNIAGERDVQRKTLSFQRWIVAKGVYRFTLGEPLPPGEYVLEVVLSMERTDMYVWDFGVDNPAVPKASKPH